MKKTILMISCLLCMQFVFAQENNNERIRKNEFGVNAGFTTGVGFSYRFWPKKVGFQLTALPIKENDNLWVSVGVTGLVKLYDAKYIRVFGYLGNHLLYKSEKEIYQNYPYSPIERTTINKLYNVGFGPGFGFGNVVKFNIMFGYSAQDILDDFNLLPTGEIGLYYAF